MFIQPQDIPGAGRECLELFEFRGDKPGQVFNRLAVHRHGKTDDLQPVSREIVQTGKFDPHVVHDPMVYMGIGDQHFIRADGFGACADCDTAEQDGNGVGKSQFRSDVQRFSVSS